MKIGIAYSDGAQQSWLRIELPEGATARDALDASGLLALYPAIDLDIQKIGVFGKIVKPDTPLQDGDRVEVYRAITCDPTQVPRRDGGDEDE